MKNELTVRTEVISVEFACSNYQRIASIPRPEFSSDVIRVKPLWKTLGLSEKRTKDSDIMVMISQELTAPDLVTVTGTLI